MIFKFIMISFCLKTEMFTFCIHFSFYKKKVLLVSYNYELTSYSIYNALVKKC